MRFSFFAISTLKISGRGVHRQTKKGAALRQIQLTAAAASYKGKCLSDIQVF
jgi:hypothetical protein